MPTTAAERLAVVDRLLADPPVVHRMAAGDDAPLGVWSTERDCYRFLAEHVAAGSRTLETGLGVSTALLAALGAEHRCVAPGTAEIERLRAHCADRGIDLSAVTFVAESSHVALPRLPEGTELDLVLVDGGHGFPLPIVDWFYAGSHLVDGGVLVVDDLPLPAVRPLLRFLDGDPRWAPLRRTEKWGAWRRVGGGSLAEDWTEQPHYRAEPDARELVAALARKARRRGERLLRRSG